MTIVALKMLQTPFASLLVMNERMASFSLIGFAEAVFSLGGAWMLRFVSSSRLEFYVVCLVLSASFVFALHVICCWRILPVGRVLSWRSQLPALTRFFSFRILSAFSNAIKIDGVALLVNAFGGVAVSAGWASAVHVRLAFQVVVDSFQQSCSPTLYKRVAAGDSAGTRRFLRWEELVSLLLICTPFVFWFACSERLIPIWFGAGSPVGLEGLVAGSALLAIIDAASGPLTVTILATGRIARFQMAMLLFAGMSFGGAWLALSHGGDAIFAMSAVAAANLLSLVYRLVHIRTAGILREKKE